MANYTVPTRAHAQDWNSKKLVHLLEKRGMLGKKFFFSQESSLVGRPETGFFWWSLRKIILD